MKKLFYASLLISCWLGLVSNAKADGQLFGSLSLITVSPTNSPIVQSNTAPIPVGKIQISYSDLSVTDAFDGNLKFSLDGVNWVTNAAKFSPPGTNAATVSVAAQTISMPIFMAFGVHTNSWNTGAVSVGGNYTSP